MARRRRYDPEFREGAVRIVMETGKPIAQVARDLGIHEGTLGNWVAKAREQAGGEDAPLSESERVELARLRSENAQAAYAHVISSHDQRPSGSPRRWAGES